MSIIDLSKHRYYLIWAVGEWPVDNCPFQSYYGSLKIPTGLSLTLEPPPTAHVVFLSFSCCVCVAEPALFTPLMSTSNSLSGVVILGGILMASAPLGEPTSTLGAVAIAVAGINVFGGFTVSYRMLLMFKKEKKA